jgi:hypothetical protein
VTDLPTTTGTDPFSYDPATDPEYQAAARELNRQIANAMNRRGIFGSTIMGENLTSAQANLIGDYREQAYNNYQKELDDKQDALDRAYENARRRGYFNNEEAALWGVTPGTRVTSSSSGGATGKAENTSDDGTKLDKDGDIVWEGAPAAERSQFRTRFNTSPFMAISFILNSKNLTQMQKDELIDTMPGAADFLARYYELLDAGYKPTTDDEFDSMWSAYQNAVQNGQAMDDYYGRLYGGR